MSLEVDCCYNLLIQQIKNKMVQQHLIQVDQDYTLEIQKKIET
jgi:hypothetical protein